MLAQETLYVMEEASSDRSTSRFMVCLCMRLVLLQIQSLKPRRKQTTWKNTTWAVAEEVVLRVDDHTPTPRGYMSAMMVDKPEGMIFYIKPRFYEPISRCSEQ